MSYPNSGTLGQNHYKRDGDRQADVRGKATITCPHCAKEAAWVIAGWARKGNSGDFTSLLFEDQQSADRRKVQAKLDGLSPQQQPQQKPEQKPCNEDDVPF